MGEDLHKGAKGVIFSYARTMRANDTGAEKILWSYLRNRQLDGFKFRRQHPILRYIADFYCHDAKLAIEVDGEIHNLADHQVYDRGRTFDLGIEGIKVIRFRNEEIVGDIDLVLEAIRVHLTLPSP
jgi:very-short-patch-repair endonuclease